jgi:hypothetical protein
VGSGVNGVNVSSDVFAVGACLAIGAGGCEVVVAAVAVIEIYKSHRFPILGKELLATLQSAAMRSLRIRLTGESRPIIRLYDYVVGENPGVVEAAFERSGSSVSPETGRTPSSGWDCAKTLAARTNQVIAKGEVLDLHLGTISGTEDARSGRETGIVLND